MKKIVYILVVSILFLMIGVTNEAELQAKAANTSNSYKGNIKITAAVLNVRQEKSVKSQIVSTVKSEEIYEVLEVGKDLKGNVWYKVKPEFGVIGWVAGWYCIKTEKSINVDIESQPGELLYECTQVDLLVKLLLLEDYSLDNVIKICGSNYTKNEEDYYLRYEYNNGNQIVIDEKQEVRSIMVDGRKIEVNNVKKTKCNILKNKGNEILIFDDSTLIILEANSKKVIKEYDTGYSTLDKAIVGNFIGDKNLELYLSVPDGFEPKRGLYQVVNDQFVRIYDTDSFRDYQGGINAKIKENDLKINVNIGEYSVSEKSILPERIFYNTKETKDKNRLISVNTCWTVEQADSKWYIKIRYTVNVLMTTYYSGPIMEYIKDNESLYNDLATVDIMLDLSNKTPKILNINTEVKYDNPKLNQITLLHTDEAMIVDGPALGMRMEEAYQSLSGKMKEVYSSYEEINGVHLSEFCAVIDSIYVESSKYETTRGMKVGDNIQKVERLYGKPDVGFSGDDFVQYKFCYKHTGQLYVDYYRTLTIYYKKGLVSAYEFSQVILD